MFRLGFLCSRQTYLQNNLHVANLKKTAHLKHAAIVYTSKHSQAFFEAHCSLFFASLITHFLFVERTNRDGRHFVHNTTIMRWLEMNENFLLLSAHPPLHTQFYLLQITSSNRAYIPTKFNQYAQFSYF